MKKGKATGPNICNICKRKKETAIREQVEKHCDCGHNECTFVKEIKAALEIKPKIKIAVQKKVNKIRILPSIQIHNGKQQ